ncbi:MAG: carboxypeptidase regulatory-like domain-containing protein [Myxococcales bacterium]|nr:carboxypeptidase regulatory-like domain-containing protein [Myxococcales bacterium]
MAQRRSLPSFLMLLALGATACSEVPASNPYDPEAPAEVQRKASLQGVVRGPDEAALVGAVVTITGPTDPDNNPLTTGEDGAFRFVDLVPGRYVMRVEHSGHEAREIDLGALGTGEAVSRDVTLDPLRADSVGQARLSGVALKQGELALADEAARDHSGITVEVEGAGLRTVTNRAGAFDLFLNPGRYTLVLTAPNHVRIVSDPIEVTAGATVTLDAPFELQSDPGAIVGVVRLEGRAEGGFGDVAVSLANTSLTTLTEPDGAFRLDGVAAGVYTLRAARDGFETQVVRGVVVESDPDVALEPIELLIARGTVEGAFGLAASPQAGGIAVELADTGFRALTNEAGAYRIDGVAEGEYTLRACLQGYEPDTRAVTVRGGETTVAPPADAPVALARQQIRLVDGGRATDTAFTVRFDALPAWVTAVKVEGDLDPAERRDFRPFDAEAGGLDVVLADGEGPRRLTVQARGDGCRLSDPLTTVVELDRSGPALVGLSFDAGALTARPDLTARLQVAGADAVRLTGDLEAVAGEAANVGAWLPASASVAVRLDGAEDGEKTVTLEARDAAGNASVPASVQATIVLDRAAPTDAALTIEDATPLTAPTVNLALRAVGATEMQVSNDPAFADAAWTPFASRLSGWTVAAPGADGEKTVYARFRDAAGNTTDAVSAAATLDRMGTLGGRVTLEGTDACDGVAVLIDGVAADASWDGCDFTAAAAVGLRGVRLERPGFEAATPGAFAVGPTDTAAVGALELRRARGSASGVVRLQGRAEGNHGGVLLTFQNVSDPVGAEALPDYGATTLPDGSFFAGDLWTGRYLVTASKDGFSVRDLGQVRVEAGRDTAVTAPDAPVVLTQQVGDFLIDGGAGFTRDREVELTLAFDNVVSFRVRVNGGAFSEPIDYAPDPDGRMRYPGLDLGVGEGAKQVEIETVDAQGTASGEPYFEASIVLDTLAPTNPALTVDGGAEYTNNALGRVVLRVGADDRNGIERVRLSAADDCQQDGPTVPFSPVVNHELAEPAVDGPKSVYACFVDPAGNVSASVRADIVLDTTPPAITGVQVIDHAGRACSEACAVNDARVLLQIGEAQAGDAAEIRLALEPDFVTGAWQPRLPGPVPLQLPQSDGPHTVYVKLRDAAGNASDAASLAMTLDRQAPPAPAADAPDYIGAPTLPVTLANTAQAVQVEVSWAADFSDADVLEPAARVDVPLPPGAAPGDHTLWVRYVDAASNRSAAVPLTTTFDTDPPVILGATLLGAGDDDVAYLASPLNVPLQVVCLDDRASQAELTLATVDRDGATDQRAASPLIGVDLPGGDGPATLTVRCADPAGNTSEPVVIDYHLDSVAPPAGQNSVTIEGGRSHVRQRSVTLELQTADDAQGSGVGAIAVANTALDCAGADYRAPVDALAWVLAAGEGGKTVAVCVRDRAGNTTPISDTIVLDSLPPAGDFTLDEGAYSASTRVTARVTRANPEATRMRLVQGVADCAGFLPAVLDDAGALYSADPQPVDLAGEGTWQVSLCLFDDAGNFTRVTRTVTVDQTAPTGNMDLDRDATYTTTRAVTVNLSTSPDVTQMKVVDVAGPGAAANCGGGGYGPVDLARAHTLPAGDGPKYVRVCLRDAAGNTAQLPAGDADGIILDATPPALRDPGTGANDGVLVEDGAAITRRSTLTVRLAADDATAGVVEFKLSEGDACTGGAWQQWAPDVGGAQSTAFAVAPGDNVERAVSVQFRDAAGNVSGCASDSIDVDTVPLVLTAFGLSGGAGDAPGYTRTPTVNITAIGHDGTGACARYEVARSNAFLGADTQTYAGCPVGPLTYTLPQAVPDGVQRLYARVVDAAGNTSGTLSATIELDRVDPTLTGINLDRGPGARPDGPKYTGLQDVAVQLVPPYAGGVRLRYALLENGAAACPAADVLPDEASVQPSLTVRFAGSGTKKVCVALVDAVGNASPVRSDTIIIDTTAPPAPNLPQRNLPGVNASCAYVEAQRADVADFWKFQVRAGTGEWADLTEGRQDPADVFDPDDPADVAHARFALEQDVDNLLQVRVLDAAGNPSEPSALVVEETSSFLVPTDLRIKQLCNGGQYAILKEQTGTVTNFRRPTCMEDRVFVEDAPEHALLDLQRVALRTLSPSLDLSDLADENCEATALNSSILDATCSPEAGEPALLIARPDTTAINSCRLFNSQPCQAISQAFPEEGLRGVVQFEVMPDPIQAPFATLSSLAQLRDASGDPASLNQLDVLDWLGDPATGDLRFRALGTNIERVHTRTCFVVPGQPAQCNVGTSWRTRALRVSTVGGCTAENQAGVHCTIRPEDPYDQVFGAGNFAIHGLSIYNTGSQYLRYDTGADAWQVAYTTAAGDEGVLVEDLAPGLTDPADDPFRNRVAPAHFFHVNSGTPPEARGNYLYLHSNGQVRARRPLTSAEQILATGGPTAQGRTAAFFEVSEDVAWWISADDPRVIFQSPTYGQNPVRLRYAVDTTQPVLPALGSPGGLGDPFVLYHTSGVTRGVVIVYRDENDEAAGACAR